MGHIRLHVVIRSVDSGYIIHFVRSVKKRIVLGSFVVVEYRWDLHEIVLQNRHVLLWIKINGLFVSIPSDPYEVELRTVKNHFLSLHPIHEMTPS